MVARPRLVEFQTLDSYQGSSLEETLASVAGQNDLRPVSVYDKPLIGLDLPEPSGFVEPLSRAGVGPEVENFGLNRPLCVFGDECLVGHPLTQTKNLLDESGHRRPVGEFLGARGDGLVVAQDLPAVYALLVQEEVPVLVSHRDLPLLDDQSLAVDLEKAKGVLGILDVETVRLVVQVQLDPQAVGLVVTHLSVPGLSQILFVAERGIGLVILILLFVEVSLAVDHEPEDVVLLLVVDVDVEGEGEIYLAIIVVQEVRF